MTNTSATKNTNCLEGIRCPQCKQEESFYVAVSQVMLLTDDGTSDRGGDHTWDDDSQISCSNSACEHQGVVRDFWVDNQKPNARPLARRPRRGNGDRAGFVMVAIEAFMNEICTDVDDALCNLLYNLMDLTAFEGWNFGKEYSRALTRYEAEQSER